VPAVPGRDRLGLRQPGTSIDVVFRLADDPYLVVPMTVAWDRPDGIANYLPAGTRYLRRQLLDGSPVPRVVRVEELAAMGSRLAPATWRRHGLGVTHPEWAHGVRVMWEAGTWAFHGWYVNLQEPLARTPTGFTTEDHFLDIVVKPDRSWTWKDEDELALAVERGRVSAGKAAAIQAEGERVATRIEARAFPFDGSLEGWRPDPGWTAPALSGAWSDIE